MATDKTEPRSGLILAFAILVIFTLIAIRFVLQTYFLSMVEHEEYIKIASAPHTSLDALHSQESEKLHGARGTVPIEEAIAQVTAPGRPGVIEPRPSTDYGALAGWTKAPANLGLDGLVRPAGSPPLVAPAPTPAPGAPTAAPATDATGAPIPAVAPAGTTVMVPGTTTPTASIPVVATGNTGAPSATGTPTRGAPPSFPLPTMPNAVPNPTAPAITTGEPGAVVPAARTAPTAGHVPQH